MCYYTRGKPSALTTGSCFVFLRVQDSFGLPSCSLMMPVLLGYCNFMSLQGLWVQRSPCPPRVPSGKCSAFSEWLLLSSQHAQLCSSLPAQNFSPVRGMRIHDANRHCTSSSQTFPKTEGWRPLLHPSLLLPYSFYLLLPSPSTSYLLRSW